ncbi:MAG: tetratricopeptide repeat protein [Duganella sp.]
MSVTSLRVLAAALTAMLLASAVPVCAAPGTVDEARLYLMGGKGVRADPSKAFTLFSKAAREGDAMAAYYLGMMYRNGMAVGRDAAEAARWLQTAVNHQVPAAMFALANLYLSGDGVERDELAARHLIEKAADLDYPDAVMAMAIGLRDGSMGFERNEALAETQLRLANRAIRQRKPGM